MPDFVLEDALEGPVAGVDEAGRGPLAGPVLAAAVVIERGCIPADVLSRIDDSKRLARTVREELCAVLVAAARIGIGAASVAEIDRLNIHFATLLAMRRALMALRPAPGVALVDGKFAPPAPCPVRTVVGGDGLCVSIAAASIVAKVTRDRIMTRLAARYPGFGFERNAGYGTPEHLLALEAYGPTPHHRRSFEPVLKMLSPPESVPLTI
jgi:ribonuclease HII